MMFIALIWTIVFIISGFIAGVYFAPKLNSKAVRTPITYDPKYKVAQTLFNEAEKLFKESSILLHKNKNKKSVIMYDAAVDNYQNAVKIINALEEKYNTKVTSTANTYINAYPIPSIEQNSKTVKFIDV